MKIGVIALLLLCFVGLAFGQSATPTATPVACSTPSLVQFASALPDTNNAGTVSIYYNSECTAAGTPHVGCTGLHTGSGLTSTPVNGDCLIFGWSFYNNLGGNLGQPAGLTQLAYEPASAGLNLMALKKIASSESGDYTFTNSVQFFPTITMAEYSGTSSTCVDSAVTGVNYNGAISALTVTYGTPSIGNEMLVSMFTNGVTPGLVFTAPSGFTTRFNQVDVSNFNAGTYFGDSKFTSTSGTVVGSLPSNNNFAGIVLGIEGNTTCATPTPTATATSTPVAGKCANQINYLTKGFAGAIGSGCGVVGRPINGVGDIR
jgi:hypothetical protein